MPKLSLLVSLVLVGLLMVVIGAPACKGGAELPVIGPMPAFSLRDQHDRTVTTDSLRGKPLIANFIFTNCPDVCPLLTTKLAGVRMRLVGERVGARYVSFTVDPANDTPAVLAAYAQKQHVDFADWSFLTGDAERVKRVIVEGWKQSIAEQPAEAGKPANILHGSHFVLVDAALRIRGYYRSDEPGLLTLVRDARILAESGAEAAP